MPTTDRFDDLDLREEPARGDNLGSEADTATPFCSGNTAACHTRTNCTPNCCG